MIAIYFKSCRTRSQLLIDSLKKLIKRVIFGTQVRKSSIEMVNDGLIKSLNAGGVKYKVIRNLDKLTERDLVISLGLDVKIFNNYKLKNPVIAGIGLMTHPSDAPDFFKKPYLKGYLQHSDWTVNIYNDYLRQSICYRWPVGIDTQNWFVEVETKKKIDFIIYEKFLWLDEDKRELFNFILEHLTNLNMNFQIIKYGEHTQEEYRLLLSLSRSMIFLCEHESQGLAYQEALSMDVPILAWDQGQWLDPNYSDISLPPVPASSVPYFNSKCGITFNGKDDFNDKLVEFLKLHETFFPREFVIQNLSYEKSFGYLMEIITHLKLDSYIEYVENK